MQEPIQCEYCGEWIKNPTYNQRYCSRSCNKKAAWRREHPKTAKIKECLKCGQKFEILDTGYARRYCYNCVPKKAYKDGASLRRLVKQWVLEEKGNKCQCCGYNTCSAALELHHLDPTQKDFNLSDRDLKLDWPTIKQEIDKCILICSNCHREIHAGVRKVMKDAK